MVTVLLPSDILSHHVPVRKIQLKGQFAIDRHRAGPLFLQIVRQMQEAIEAGRVARGTRLPSTRSLARTLGVSRNTVLTAYEELVARGFIRSRRGAGMYVFVPAAVSGFDVRAVMCEAQYPSRTIALRDQDGNPLYISY
jgi:GntR family transcriptional regulator/MocR family aminotransferase